MTDTLASRMNVALFSGGLATAVQPQVYRKDSGVLVVSGQPVFRSGQFRDSMGFQHTWEALHMDQMVSHYRLLRDRGLFGDVPVRDGHPGFLVHGTPGTGQVIGWHTDLEARELETHSGSKETFLLATYEITDPEARARYENKTYRNRSSEVGEYTTNDEATFWPTYMGFAFVDIPAVEGLNAVKYNSAQTGRSFSVLMEKGFSVGTESSDKNTGGAPTGQMQMPVPPPPAPAPTVQHTAPVAPQAPKVEMSSFSVNGQTVTDPTVVQAHITSLETFRSETITNGRLNFVSELARNNKILATQVDSLGTFAKSLNDEQFANWKTAMEAAPSSSMLGNFAATGATQGEPGRPQDEAKAARVMTLKGVVAMHHSRGANAEEIKASESYKELVRLDPSAAI